MQWAAELDVTVRLESTDCYRCGIPFAMPRDYMRKLQQTGETFWCPAGHGQVYAEPENARLRRQLQTAQERAAHRAADLEAARSTLRIERRQHAATKGQLTKERKRAGAGVCPVDDCHRSFTNLRRHMTAKHPDYAAQAAS